MTRIAVELPADPASIPVARDALEELAGLIPEERLDDLRLVVSELVTNSVRHAGLSRRDSIDLRLSVEPTAIRLEIRDRGQGFEPPTAPASLFQESGWGLYLVSQLTDRWGVAADAAGTLVWAEIDR